MAITVNSVPIETLPIGSCVVTIRNQEADRADIALNIDYDAALPSSMFNEGSEIRIAVDGLTIFAGYCLPAKRDAAAASTEQVRIIALSPWNDLAETPVYQSYTDPVSGLSYATSRLQLYGWANLLLNALVDGAIAAGCRVQKGTIDVPSVPIPIIEETDLSYAAALQAVLRWSPSSVAYLDYSYSPPALHVKRLSSGGLGAQTTPAEYAHTYALRSDLVAAGVHVVYERPYSLVTRYNDGHGYTSSTRNTSTLVSEDTAGATTGRRVISVAHQLSGGLQKTTTRHLFNGSLNNLIWWEARSSDGRVQPWIGDLCHYTGAQFVKVTTSYGTHYAPNTGLAYCTLAEVSGERADGGSGALDHSLVWPVLNRKDWIGWDGVPDQKLFGSGGFEIWKITINMYWANAASSPSITQRTAWTLIAVNYGGNQSPFGRTLEVTEDTTGDTLEPAPSGMAAMILSENSTAFYEGQMVKPVSSFVASRRAALVGSSRSPIQQVVLDLGNDTASYSFGPPVRLRPADLFALTRGRKRPS